MPKATQQDAYEAIKVIISDHKKYDTTLNYAINYCHAAMMMVGYELSVQCIYILNNITSWRHSQAKHVRQVLKSFIKETNNV